VLNVEHVGDAFVKYSKTTILAHASGAAVAGVQAIMRRRYLRQGAPPVAVKSNAPVTAGACRFDSLDETGGRCE
jgi:hypothetical protein